jgi:hypothetical protein
MSDISTTILTLTLDAGVREGAELLGYLRLLGYELGEAMPAVRDAVHAGLVSHH